MNNSQFLLWLSDRLVNVYGESENTDFVLKLPELATKESAPLTTKQELIRDLLSGHLSTQIAATNIPELVAKFDILAEEILQY